MTDVDPVTIIARAFDARAETYDRRWAEYIARTTELTIKAMPALDRGARVLDVGCGTGQLLAVLQSSGRELSLTGTDVSETMLARASERLGGEVTLRCAPAEALPFENGSFDVVVTVSSLHFWRSPERGLAEMARIVAPGGVIVITDWARDGWRMKVMDRYLRFRDPAHHRTLARDELAALAAAAALRVTLHTFHPISWLWQIQVLTARRSAP